jgi:hypothetical protein
MIKFHPFFVQLIIFVNFLNLNFEKTQVLEVKLTRKRKFKMLKSEILTITDLFHIGGYKTFKYFYLFYVQKHLYSEFSETVCYIGL